MYVPIDGDAYSASASEDENSDIVQFMWLEPSRYNRSSFDIGTLIRFAGLEKDKWHWGVVSTVGQGMAQGPFKLSIRLCGNVNPARNGVEIVFPTEIYELVIDKESFQHEVENVATLPAGDHVRFGANRISKMG